MQSLYLQELKLENYRNFNRFDLKISNHPIALIGKNGTGKTNILEAISQLFPGKGLRSAKFDEICRYGENHWTVRAILNGKLGTCDLSIQCTSKIASNASDRVLIEGDDATKNTSKKSNLFNGAKIPNHELSSIASIIWLTPQMDGIFLGSSSDRRKFFDRIVYNFDLSHAANINKYEYYVHERVKLLTSDFVDDNWVKIIEQKLADVARLIAISRVNTLRKMQKTIDNLESEFPKALLDIDGEIEKKILDGKGNLNEFIEGELLKQRSKDRITGRTHFGTHRSDFLVIHQKHNKPAKFCSTGEQKAMLVSIALAQVHSIINDQMVRPIVLLDEVFVHLDDKRKAYLSEFIIFSNIQAWITATDSIGIEKFTNSSQLIRL